MGMFDFLKKSKTETADVGMELPPVPKMEEPGAFPEMKKEEAPGLPDTSLPPLPTEVPGEIPPAPKIEEMKAPKAEMPELPKMEDSPEKVEPKDAAAEEKVAPEISDMPTPEEIKDVMGKMEAEMEGKAEFPAIPEKVSEDMIPDRIPPLEGLPEPPEFKAEPAPAVPAAPVEEAAMPEPEPVPEAVEPEAHPVYVAPEAPQPVRIERKGPLYIRSDRFKAVLDDIAQIRSKFKEEDDFFLRLTDIKSAQDQKFEDFRQSLEDVQRKLLFIDRTLFEAK